MSKKSGSIQKESVADQANKENELNRKNELLKEAITHFDFAINMNPRYIHANMHRAASYHLMKDFDKSISQYRQAALYWPNDLKVKKALAMSLRDKGQQLGSKQNDLEAARIFLNESITNNNQDSKSYWLMAVSYAKQNDFKSASEWFLKAIALDPKNATYLYDLGTSYFRLNDKVKGSEYYDKAIAINPNIIKERTKQ